MRRRTLLQAILALVALPRVAAARAPRPVLSMAIAGTSYHGTRGAAAALRLGERLTLRREPANPYDPNAVEVLSAGGVKLGYVPRRAAGEVAALLDAGRDVRAEIAAFLPVPARGERFAIPEGLVRTWCEPGEPIVGLTEV